MRHHTQRARRPVGLPALAATLLAAGSAGALAASVSAAPHFVARSAKVIHLNENGNLHLTSKPRGFTLNERGAGTGSVRGTIYVHLKIVSSSRVTAELNIYPKGGSITAHGSAAYHKERTLARFSGTMSIDRGTGTYAHAHGSGLSFSGTIQKSNDAVTVHVAGRAVD